MSARSAQPPVPAAPLRWAAAETDLGWLLMAAGQEGIVWLQFGDAAAGLEAALLADFPGQSLRRDDSGLAAWMGAVCALLADGSANAARAPTARTAAEALPLAPRGTEFQRQVWSALRAIPRGETRTYTQVAAQIGRPAAVRAVGGACARNSIALLIPCHRVLAAASSGTTALGGLAGFRWGLWRKQKLLELEQAPQEVAEAGEAPALGATEAVAGAAGREVPARGETNIFKEA